MYNKYAVFSWLYLQEIGDLKFKGWRPFDRLIIVSFIIFRILHVLFIVFSRCYISKDARVAVVFHVLITQPLDLVMIYSFFHLVFSYLWFYLSFLFQNAFTEQASFKFTGLMNFMGVGWMTKQVWVMPRECKKKETHSQKIMIVCV